MQKITINYAREKRKAAQVPTTWELLFVTMRWRFTNCFNRHVSVANGELAPKIIILYYLLYFIFSNINIYMFYLLSHL